MAQSLCTGYGIAVFVLTISLQLLAGGQNMDRNMGMTNIQLISCDNDNLVALAGQGGIRLCCRTSSEYLHNRRSWYLNGFLLKQSKNALMVGAELRLLQLSQWQAGSYHCCIADQLCSSPVDLTVIDRPVIELVTDGVMVGHLGSNLTLSAFVSGNHNDLLWYAIWYNSNDLSPISSTTLNFTKLSSHTLAVTLNNLQYDHQGIYYLCVSSSYSSEQSSSVLVQVHGPPEPPSIIAIEQLQPEDGSGPRLRIRWNTPRPPKDREHNRLASRYEVFWRYMDGYDRRWSKRSVDSIEEAEYDLDHLDPCTDYEVQIHACSSVGCSASIIASQSTGSDPSSWWLSDSLYEMANGGNTLLLKREIDARELCVSRTLNLSSMLALCDLPVLPSHSTGVFTMDFSCPDKGTDIMECSYTCPVPAPRCGPSYTTISIRKLCTKSEDGTLPPEESKDTMSTLTTATIVACASVLFAIFEAS